MSTIDHLTEYETTPLRVDVPLDLHPDILAPHIGPLSAPDSLGGRALTATREAMVKAYKTIGQFNDIERSLYEAAPPGKTTTYPGGKSSNEGVVMTRRGVRTVPPAGDVEAYLRAAEIAQKGVTSKLEHSQEQVLAARTCLEREVAKALTDPDASTPLGMTIASEIRGHVKTLPSDKRTPFVDKAIRDGDFKTVSAVLAGPGYLSGLDPKMHGIFRDLAARRWAGPHYEQLQVVPHLEKALLDAGRMFNERVAKARSIPRTPIDAAKKGIAQLEKAR